jgi:hypothetical protein
MEQMNNKIIRCISKKKQKYQLVNVKKIQYKKSKKRIYRFIKNQL